ncbi:MAG: glycosyltransferase family 4 protein [Bacteroidia bacterium]|nr:glycosyltransferase family 4 protein [Bacteroidia bacterium]
MRLTKKKVIYVVNVDWFFISHRLPLALEAKKRGYDVVIATTNTGRFKELEDLGFELFDLKIKRSGTNPLNEFFSIIKLIKTLKKVKPTVIHNVTLKMSIYSSIATRFVKINKVINAISGLGYNFTADRKTQTQKIINTLMKFAFNKRGFSFIFQNPDDLKLFQKLNFDVGNKFCLIKGAGIDLDKFNFSERRSRNVVSFILTARMLKDKGISEFIIASKVVSINYPNTRFILVGDIDKENPASFKEDELKNELQGANIEWLGHRNDILELLQDSDVMVFPSYREGLPKSLIEAAAMGLPIITTDTIGCKDCVDEGINGFLVPVGNSTILAEKMIYLIENPAIIEKMGKASRIKAMKEFSLSMVIEKTFELYD